MGHLGPELECWILEWFLIQEESTHSHGTELRESFCREMGDVVFRRAVVIHGNLVLIEAFTRFEH